MSTSPLKFKVAPNIVEDLGLNLYTSLPRVLAEYVANAHDADSPAADISIDVGKIKAAREKLNQMYAAERARVALDTGGDDVEALGTRTLPADVTIVISDTGVGMSRDDLAAKFLVAGRRRRLNEPAGRTAGGRLVMGRKGLGKLAGFGVAKSVEVVTRKAGEAQATKITITYDELVEQNREDEVLVKEEPVEENEGPLPHGTRITLSRLLYDPAKSALATIGHELAEHFELIKPEEFAVRVNGEQVEPLSREFGYAWPEPERPADELVNATYTTEEGAEFAFRYRMRFVPDKKALRGQRRGVRVYARGRLASSPSLLDASTNMHGFRMTDYLDGIVEADFLDGLSADFIATDRQSLRWESPLLVELKRRLSGDIRKACTEYQKLRDGRTPKLVRDDPFTVAEIKKAGLEGRDETMALRIGTILAKSCKQSVSDPIYKAKFPQILKGIGHGTLFAAIAALAADNDPDLQEVAAKIIELTHEEVDTYVNMVRIRVTAIAALERIVDAADFSLKRNEKEVQKLMEGAPWMIDPIYAPALSADKSMSNVYRKLAEHLQIGSHAPVDADRDDDRPDLVFLLGNQAGGRVVIVELKAPNVKLGSDHLDQLQDYMHRTKVWLAANAPSQAFAVHGELIGMRDTESRGRKQTALAQRIAEAGVNAPWRVRTFIEVLNTTSRAHQEMLDAYRRLADAAPHPDDAEDLFEGDEDAADEAADEET